MSATRDVRQTSLEDVSPEANMLRLADLAAELGSQRVREDAAALAQRTAEGRFYVACIGQFKRGKSTLLDALLADHILPTGVLPVTAVPTIVRYGPARGARVRFQGGAWLDVPPEDLAQYVSEALNPENNKNVAAVEAFSPSPLLAQGMCFVDTPGLGSVFAGNTAATQAFIPHIDAAIVVLGADPPISADELALLEEVAKHVRHLLIVLNKADKTSDADRAIAKSFTGKLLEKHLRRSIRRVYEISAAERLENRGPQRDWPDLCEDLETLEQDAGRSLVRNAAERGLRRLSDELVALIAAEKDALQRPLEESESRMQNLRQTISEADRSLRDVRYLLMSEEHHLSDMFLEQRKQFLARAWPILRAEFENELSTLPRRYGPKFRRDAMRSAQALAARHVQPWLQSEQSAAEHEYRKVASRFVGIGNDFLAKLSASGVPELARMPHALDSEKGFRVPSRFTFEELLRVAQPASPLRYLADVFLGAARGFAVIERQAREFLAHLVEMNSTRVQSDVINRVQESRAQLELEIRKLLHEVSRVAEQALEHARAARSAGAPAVAAAKARLDALESAIRRTTVSNPETSL